MQETSDLYKELFASPHDVEVRLTIGESGRLVTELGDTISFGGTNILVADGGPDSGFDEDYIASMKTKASVFAGSPSVGNCLSAEIDVKMRRPKSELPKRARLAPYIRLTDGIRHSEWLQKGVFFIDTREYDVSYGDLQKIHLHGYDAMMMMERRYPPSNLDWPALDVDVVKEIANSVGLSIDKRTFDVMVHAYKINYPANYYSRTVLSMIAAMYGGNWFMTDSGELRLAMLSDIPKETRYLIDEDGFIITFGGDRIVI